MYKTAVVLATSVVMIASCGTPQASRAQSNGLYTEAPNAKSGDVGESVISSLRYLQWEILEQGDGYYIAKATHKGQWATAKVTFNDSSYKIDYVDSANMDGGSRNHVWMRWSHALDSDIRAGLGLSRLPG